MCVPTKSLLKGIASWVKAEGVVMSVESSFHGQREKQMCVPVMVASWELISLLLGNGFRRHCGVGMYRVGSWCAPVGKGRRGNWCYNTQFIGWGRMLGELKKKSSVWCASFAHLKSQQKSHMEVGKCFKGCSWEGACDGCSWLLTWLHLELGKTQPAGYTCKRFFFS